MILEEAASAVSLSPEPRNRCLSSSEKLPTLVPREVQSCSAEQLVIQQGFDDHDGEDVPRERQRVERDPKAVSAQAAISQSCVHGRERLVLVVDRASPCRSTLRGPRILPRTRAECCAKSEKSRATHSGMIELGWKIPAGRAAVCRASCSRASRTLYSGARGEASRAPRMV